MTQIDDPEDEPLDPAVEKIRQRMMRMLFINGMIMIGLMAVLFAIVYKINNRSESGADTDARSIIPGDEDEAKPLRGSRQPFASNIEVDIPDGARVISSALSRKHLMLELRLEDNSRQIWLVDMVSGEIKSRVVIK